MEAFHLDVEEALDVDLLVEGLFDECGEPALVLPLDLHELLQELLVLDELLQVAELEEVRNPSVSDSGGDEPCQRPVAEEEPPALCDAVGHVRELARPHLREILEDDLLENPGVDLRDPVDMGRADDGKIRHSDGLFAPLLDDAHAAELVQITGIP